MDVLLLFFRELEAHFLYSWVLGNSLFIFPTTRGLLPLSSCLLLILSYILPRAEDFPLCPLDKRRFPHLSFQGLCVLSFALLRAGVFVFVFVFPLFSWELEVYPWFYGGLSIPLLSSKCMILWPIILPETFGGLGYFLCSSKCLRSPLFFFLEVWLFSIFPFQKMGIILLSLWRLRVGFSFFLLRTRFSPSTSRKFGYFHFSRAYCTPVFSTRTMGFPNGLSQSVDWYPNCVCPSSGTFSFCRSGGCLSFLLSFQRLKIFLLLFYIMEATSL